MMSKPRSPERLDRQINVRLTEWEHETLLDWARENHWPAGTLVRLIVREAVAVYCREAGISSDEIPRIESEAGIIHRRATRS